MPVVVYEPVLAQRFDTLGCSMRPFALHVAQQYCKIISCVHAWREALPYPLELSHDQSRNPSRNISELVDVNGLCSCIYCQRLTGDCTFVLYPCIRHRVSSAAQPGAQATDCRNGVVPDFSHYQMQVIGVWWPRAWVARVRQLNGTTRFQTNLGHAEIAPARLQYPLLPLRSENREWSL